MVVAIVELLTLVSHLGVGFNKNNYHYHYYHYCYYCYHYYHYHRYQYHYYDSCLSLGLVFISKDYIQIMHICIIYNICYIRLCVNLLFSVCRTRPYILYVYIFCSPLYLECQDCRKQRHDRHAKMLRVKEMKEKMIMYTECCVKISPHFQYPSPSDAVINLLPA